MPLAVSVCVPTYNGAPFLAECLDSILAQTLTNFEVLIVDDCSRDATIAIAEGYAARDARIRVLRNPHNLGLVGNWNRCVELAGGEWIKFVFQDDLIAPTCLERMLAVGDQDHLLVSCARDFIFEAGTRSEDVNYLRWHQQLVATLLSGSVSAERFSELTLQHLDHNLIGEPTVVLLHRSVFTRFGLFNEHIAQVVDAEYWARVGASVGVVHLHDVLATFRVHPSSTSSVNGSTRQTRIDLDALVVRHEYAFNPVYAPLRAVAHRIRPRRDLVREFWAAAYRSLVLDARRSALDRADPRSRSEAQQVFAAYPRLLDVPLRYRVRYRIASYLDRHEGAARIYRAAKRIVG